MTMTDPLAGPCAGLDLDATQREYQRLDDLIFLRDFLPPSLVAPMIEETRALVSRAVWSWAPLTRKAGAVGQADIVRHAPTLTAVYRSPAMLALAERLAGQPLAYKSEHDAHAAALYLYQRPGDYVNWHVDDCGCEDEASYTATIGLIHDTRSRAQYELYRGRKDRDVRNLYVRMDPGSLLFFCGSKPRHRVTPLHRGEERIVFSFAFVKPGKRVSGRDRFLENLKDAIAYFGPRALFQKNY